MRCCALIDRATVALPKKVKISRAGTWYLRTRKPPRTAYKVIEKAFWVWFCSKRPGTLVVDVAIPDPVHLVTLKLPSTQNIRLPSCVIASTLTSYLPSGAVCGLNGIGGELTSA